MAQTDLIAQKILSTDPQVGFGESAVLPYRQRQIDTRGLEAMERARTRQEAAEEARKKNNEDYYNTTIKNLPEYQREFEQGLGGWRNEIIDRAYQNNVNGITNDPGLVKDVMAYTQAAKATKQINDDLEKINTMPLGKYTNRESVKGAALKKYTELVDRANKRDRSAFSESIIPDLNDPEHVLFDEYYNDKYGKRGDTVTSEDHISYGAKGERVIGKKVTARFVTTKKDKNGIEIKDKNGNPIVVHGVDQSIIDDDLYSETTDPNTLQFRNAIFSLADKQILNKALELKQSGDPRYENMGTTQIASSISANPKDPHYAQFNRNKIAEDIDRKKVEAFQKVSTDNSIGALNEYNKDGGSGSTVSSPEGIFIKNIAGLQQQIPEIVSGLDESTELNESGVPYLDATSLLGGIKTGENSKGKPEEPYAVYIDPEKPGTIFIKQNQNGPIVPVSGAAISEFIVRVGNIKGNNLQYKPLMQEGYNQGVFGKNNQFLGENAVTPDPAFSKEQRELSKAVASEAVDRKDKLTQAIGKDKKSWITDWNRGTVDEIQNNINNQVLKGTTFVDGDGVSHEDPKVKIERGLLGGITYIITDSNNVETTLTEDEFASVAEGKSKARLVVGRKSVSENSDSNNKPSLYE